MKDLKTTSAGLLLFVSTLSLQVSYMLDSNPSTVPDWAVVALAFVTFMGFLFSKDSTKE